MEPWPNSIFLVSKYIIEMDFTLSHWIPSLWSKSYYGMKGHREAP